MIPDHLPNEFWAAFWTAIGGLAAFIGVLVVLLNHMLAFAKGQGGRDEREKQAAEKIAALELKVAEHGSANAAMTTQLAVLTASVGSLKEGMEKGLTDFGTQLAQIGHNLNNVLMGKVTPARRSGRSDG